MNLSIGRIYPCACMCACVHATCRGRLSTRQQHPKAISSRLVRMKALIALVTFWILPSLLGPAVWLIGHKHTAHLPLYAGPPCTSVNSSILVILLLTDSLHVPLLCAWGDGRFLVTLLHLPVHDVSDQRTCHQAQQLKCAKHGRVETH